MGRMRSAATNFFVSSNENGIWRRFPRRQGRLCVRATYWASANGTSKCSWILTRAVVRIHAGQDAGNGALADVPEANC